MLDEEPAVTDKPEGKLQRNSRCEPPSFPLILQLPFVPALMFTVSVERLAPVEDVEPTAVLDFPPTSSQGASDITALKNSISSIQKDVSKLKSGETSVSSDGGVAYDFAIFGLSIAAAAIILAIVALIKRK